MTPPAETALMSPKSDSPVGQTTVEVAHALEALRLAARLVRDVVSGAADDLHAAEITVERVYADLQSLTAIVQDAADQVGARVAT